MLIFLSSYNPHNFSQVFKSNNIFFGIQKIIIKDNALITKNEIEEKLRNIYNKNILFLQRSDIERSLENNPFKRFNINYLERLVEKRELL